MRLSCNFSAILVSVQSTLYQPGLTLMELRDVRLSCNFSAILPSVPSKLYQPGLTLMKLSDVRLSCNFSAILALASPTVSLVWESRLKFSLFGSAEEGTMRSCFSGYLENNRRVLCFDVVHLHQVGIRTQTARSKCKDYRTT